MPACSGLVIGRQHQHGDGRGAEVVRGELTFVAFGAAAQNFESADSAEFCSNAYKTERAYLLIYPPEPEQFDSALDTALKRHDSSRRK